MIIRYLALLIAILGTHTRAEEPSQAWVAAFKNDAGLRVGVTSESLTKQTFPELASLVAKGLTLESFSAVLSTDYNLAEINSYTFRYILRYRGLNGGKTKTTYARGGFATSLSEAFDLAVLKFKSEEQELKAEHELCVLDSISIIREKIPQEAQQAAPRNR